MSYYFEDEDWVIEKGCEVKCLLRAYGLDVFKIHKEKFLLRWSDPESNMLLHFEEGRIEYRVEIGYVYDRAELERNWGVESEEEDFPSKYEISHHHVEEFLEDVEKAKLEPVLEDNSPAFFSVFLEDDLDLEYIEEEDKETYENLVCYCLGKAYEYYFGNLAHFKYVNFSNNMEAYDRYLPEFKQFLHDNHIEITNDNLEAVGNYSYRLYKDGKFFYIFEEQFREKWLYNRFMHDFKEL
jgi:hypothetical protein